MKLLIVSTALAAMLTLPAQAQRLTNVDIADATTTAIGVWSGGFYEANPITGIAGNGASPLVALALKIGAKRFMIRLGATPAEADYYVGTGSAFGAGNNMAVLLGASGPLGIAAGVLMALAYLDMNDPANPKSRDPNWDYWHGAETR